MIQIKNPCDANWQEMTPAASGKYCGACEKVVVDFSNMNDLQIKEYFTSYATQKTCGRFLTSQVDRPLKATSVSSKFWKSINSFPVFRYVILIWASSVLWLTNCVSKDRTTGEVEGQTCEPMITGDTISIPIHPDTTTKIEDDSIHTVGFIAPIVKMGEVATPQARKCLPQEVVMGDFIVPSPDESDTVAVTILSTEPDEKDTVIHMIKGKVMMTDTISQKIKLKRK